MTDYISEPPPDMELYLNYIVRNLNDFIDGVSEYKVIIDSMTESESDLYDNRVTLRLEKAEPYSSRKVDPDFSQQVEGNEEDMCIYLEDDEYIHILSSTKDWSKFDRQKIFELCVDTILSEKST